MSPFLYAINIATLAVWLSVASFGTIGIVVPVTLEILHRDDDPKDLYEQLESMVLTEDFATGDLPPSQETDTGSTGEAEEIDVPFAEEDTLPTPPEMPEIADLATLPDVPDLPPPAAKPRPAPTPESTRPSKPTNPTGGSSAGKTTAKGKTGSGGSNGGSGMSDAKRLAGGRMPAPSYPSSARARGQQGTVLVEFVIGENGRVISSYAKSPSPWPILNERAVSCVRTWRFPPGKVSKFVRPIVFKLN